MAGELLAENDPAFGKIVGRHFHVNAVANDRANAVATHFASCVSDDPTLIVEHHPEPAVRQNLVDNAFDCKQFFFHH